MQDSGIATDLLGTLLPVKTQVLIPYRFCNELFYCTGYATGLSGSPTPTLSYISTKAYIH
jgi:hypothetical protein